MTQKGFFITMEGGEGAGKTTQREFIAEYLRNYGYEVVVTREPGGTSFAEQIRQLLLTPTEEFVDGLTELMLVFAARNQHVQQLVIPALNRGAVVICDRFVDSTFAYQGFGRDMPTANIEALERLVLGEFKPDMTFLLDISSQVGLKRAAARGVLDRMELQGQAFFSRVRTGFHTRAEQDPARIKLIDASQPIEQVQAQILPHLMELVNKHKQRPNIEDSLYGNETRTTQ